MKSQERIKMFKKLYSNFSVLKKEEKIIIENDSIIKIKKKDNIIIGFLFLCISILTVIIFIKFLYN